MTTEHAKNRTLIVQVIVENVVNIFLSETQCSQMSSKSILIISKLVHF